MKTTHVLQLPEAMIERIYVEIQKENPRGCQEEHQDALNSRLCDLEDFININLLMSEMETWKALNREVGHFEYGDLIWDVDGNTFMVTQKSVPPNKISLEDVKELYRSGYVQKICIDEEVLSFNGGIEQ